MKTFRLAMLTLTLAASAAGAGAQGVAPPPPSHPHSAPHPIGPGSPMPMHPPMGTMMAHGAGHRVTPPTEAGQAAFAAIQEIVARLQADPGTDWSKVDIDALRQHLIDMDEVTMRANVGKTLIDGGLRIAVTGSDRTLAAIRRMVPDHAKEIDGMRGWTVRAMDQPNGVELTVTSGDPAEAQKIRALGFMGIMTQGSHHQVHHLGMAQGDPTHRH